MLNRSLLAAVLAVASSSGMAAGFSLNFEGINPTYSSTTGQASILEFYNGGTSSAGTSGVNYGVSFGSNALAVCLNSLTVVCSNSSRGGLAPGSSTGGLFFLSGTQTFLNVASGFDVGFSFNYSSINYSGSVLVYSGTNGTGTLLGTLNLTPNGSSCLGYSAQFCPYAASGITFSGIAHSVSFGGVANQIGFDDITFGSVIPGVPEPETGALLIIGIAFLATRVRSTSRLA